MLLINGGKWLSLAISTIRFDGIYVRACKRLTLTLNSKSFALYSNHREDKTLSRNHKSRFNSSLEKWQESFADAYVLTATLWFWTSSNVYIFE